MRQLLNFAGIRGGSELAILKGPPKQPKNVTVQIRVEEDVKAKLEIFADFIEASPSFVVTEALRLVFRNDEQFTHWLEQHPSNSDDLVAEEGTPRETKKKA